MTEPSEGGLDDRDEREETPPPLTKEQIEGHILAMKSIIKDYNRQNKADPIRLDFGTDNIPLKEGRVAKGKDIGEEDLSKPFKEKLKTPLTRRIIEFAGTEYVMPTNITLYDGSTDPADNLNRFSMAANSGEWPMPEAFTTRYSIRRACYKEPHEITKVVRRANETLPAFKERWTVETSLIMGVPKVMKISSFMDSIKSPELAKRFSSNIPKIVDEMMRMDHKTFIKATETQLQLPAPRPVANPLRTGEPDKYCDYHQDKGHHINDCIMLRKQLEIALESGKLNHLMKDLRQRVGRGQGRNPPPSPKVINMVGVLSSKEKKRKDREATKAWMNTPITFPRVISDDASNEPLIIEAKVEGYLVRRVYVDEGSSVEVMFEHCFKNLPAKVRAGLRETRTDLVGFAGEVAKPLGKIDLETRVESTACYSIDYPLNDQVPHFERNSNSGDPVNDNNRMQTSREKQILTEKQPEIHEAGQPNEGADPTKQVLVNPCFPDQIITIGERLSPDCKSQLKTLLINNMEVFAWEPYDMTGVPRKIIEHSLNVNPSLEPFFQKKRTFSPEKSKAITNERMCIDFKNLNSACPKDYYPLPSIDCKVEAVMDFKYKCFLDAYKGYHQIQMAREDEDKTAFYTEQGTYCYMKMPFGLKNAGVTYQRLVDSTFQNQIGKNLEAYVDDMVIKRKDEKDLLADIAETFENLKAINIKLNPKKISFGVEEGKFVGYMVTSEGIRANPKKTKAMSDLTSPKTLKEMQSLSGKLASLNRGPRRREVAFQHDEEANHIPFHHNTPFPKEDTVLIYLEWQRKACTSASTADRSKRKTMPSPVCQVLADFLSDAPDGEAEEEYFRMPEVPPEIDSKLVANQSNGTYEATKESMIKYLTKAKEFISEFKTFSIKNIPREDNQNANILSKLATVLKATSPKEILVEVPMNEQTALRKCKTNYGKREGENWMTPIIKYSEEGIVPLDKNEERSLRAKISQYAIESGVLFKKGYLVPMLRCVGPLQANYVIQKIHMGSYGMYIGPRAVVRKAMRQGYYWPTMHVDAKEEDLNQTKAIVKLLSLTSEVMHGIPGEMVKFPSYRTLMIREEYNKEEQCLNLDLLQERREAAAIREAKYKTKMEQYYNKKVRPAGFRPGEFVYRRNEAIRMEDEGKLGPNWEGPYRVSRSIR
ncbi:reverse transcriptase domain-containing protein [Tanacetum coccineum]